MVYHSGGLELHLKMWVELRELEVKWRAFFSFLESNRLSDHSKRIPCGFMLNGRAGASKKILRCVATGKARVSYFSTAGQGFDEIHVDVGALEDLHILLARRTTLPAKFPYKYSMPLVPGAAPLSLMKMMNEKGIQFLTDFYGYARI